MKAKNPSITDQGIALRLGLTRQYVGTLRNEGMKANPEQH